MFFKSMASEKGRKWNAKNKRVGRREKNGERGDKC